MKQGIIFDMDGTLWDSAENVAKSWNEAIKKDGSVKRELTTADIQGVMGKTMDERTRRCALCRCAGYVGKIA